MLSIFGSSYINSCLKICPTINSLCCDDNSITYSYPEKCELFNYFLVCLQMKTVPPFLASNSTGVLPLTDVEITPAIVFDNLMHLNPSKSLGPEEWLILSLKEMAQQLCAPLCILYKNS